MHPGSEKPVLVPCLKESLERSQSDYKTAYQTMQMKEGESSFNSQAAFKAGRTPLGSTDGRLRRQLWGNARRPVHSEDKHNCLLWLLLSVASELAKVSALSTCDTITSVLTGLAVNLNMMKSRRQPKRIILVLLFSAAILFCYISCFILSLNCIKFALVLV